ncbi:uncharacterized protein METZ01_LOCUS359929 [marine metagenome]|uniref:Uncharacterized protein n=1 Tax=marine metagenome TaxID=408172 RepID=A0A382SC89_9ZZZZ
MVVVTFFAAFLGAGFDLASDFVLVFLGAGFLVVIFSISNIENP